MASAVQQNAFVLRRALLTIASALALALVGVALGVTLLLMLVGFAFGHSPFDSNPFDDRKFDRAVWLEYAACVTGGNQRGPMAQDILRHILRPGMTAPEIESILGRVQYRWSMPEVNEMEARPEVHRFVTAPASTRTRAASAVGYYLGEELDMAWGIDTAWLVLFLDSHGRYLGAQVCG